MSLRNKTNHLLLAVPAVLFLLTFAHTAAALPDKDAPGSDSPEPTHSPDQPPNPAPAPTPANNPCYPSMEPFVLRPLNTGYASEPGMPGGRPLGGRLSSECIAFLRNKASNGGSAVVAIFLKDDGTDALRLTIRDGVPDNIPSGTTFVRFANESKSEAIGVGAWEFPNEFFRVRLEPNTRQFVAGTWLRRHGSPLPPNVDPSIPFGETVMFDRPVLWWFEVQAYWARETFWELFDGKLVEFTYISN